MPKFDPATPNQEPERSHATCGTCGVQSVHEAKKIDGFSIPRVRIPEKWIGPPQRILQHEDGEWEVICAICEAARETQTNGEHPTSNEAKRDIKHAIGGQSNRSRSRR